MDGRDGSWALLYGADPVSDTALNLAVDEDQLSDEERYHVPEQVGFLAVSSSVNQAPVLDPIGDKSAIENELLSFTVTATDPDGPPPLSLEATGLPAGADFADNGSGSGTFSWTPSVGDSTSSPYAVTFTATDGDGQSDSEAISIAVSPEPVNQAPVLDPIGDKSAIENELLSFTVTATDPDGPPPLSLEATGLPAGADFADNGSGSGTFSWTPSVGDSTSSPYAVTFTATDGDGQSEIGRASCRERVCVGV